MLVKADWATDSFAAAIRVAVSAEAALELLVTDGNFVPFVFGSSSKCVNDEVVVIMVVPQVGGCGCRLAGDR